MTENMLPNPITTFNEGLKIFVYSETKKSSTKQNHLPCK